MKNSFNYHKIIRVVLYTVLLIGAISFIFPYIWMMISSFKSLGEIRTYPPTLLPKVWTTINYQMVFDLGFGKFFLNSLFVTITSTAIILYTSSYLGYLLAKIKFKGKVAIFIIIVSTMMIPWPVIIVPLWNFVNQLGWLNTYLAIILPFSVDAFGIFLVRQFVIGLSDEIIESAKLEGASQFRIFHSIILPQLLPVLSALGIFTFIWQWDNLLWPYLVLTKEKLYTLPLGLVSLKGQHYNETGAIVAASTITMVPVIIVFLFAQRRFVDGMSFTGIKQ